MQSLGLYNQYKEQEIYSIWPEVVGRMIAERTRKLEVVNGRLFVSFTSAVVRNEMMMVKEGLVRSLNERIGRDVIKELVIR